MSGVDAMHEAQLLIEPAARRIGRYPHAQPNEQQIHLSIAISMKRIADSLERPTITGSVDLPKGCPDAGPGHDVWQFDICRPF